MKMFVSAAVLNCFVDAVDCVASRANVFNGTEYEDDAPCRRTPGLDRIHQCGVYAPAVSFVGLPLPVQC